MKLKKTIFTIISFVIFLTEGLAQTAEQPAVNSAYSYTLETLLTATQMNHPEVLKLQEEYYRSNLDIKDAWAGLQPVLDFQASGTYMTKPPVEEIYVDTDQI